MEPVSVFLVFLFIAAICGGFFALVTLRKKKLPKVRKTEGEKPAEIDNKFTIEPDAEERAENRFSEPKASGQLQIDIDEPELKDVVDEEQKPCVDEEDTIKEPEETLPEKECIDVQQPETTDIEIATPPEIFHDSKEEPPEAEEDVEPEKVPELPTESKE